MNRFLSRVALVLLMFLTATILYKGHYFFQNVSKSQKNTNTIVFRDKKSETAPNLKTAPSQNPLTFRPKPASSENRPATQRKVGQYVGSPGQHKYFYSKARGWEVDPDTVLKFCRTTNLTQCSPPTKRTKQQKEQDRTARGKPFRVTVFRPFKPDPRDPDFSECEYDNCVYAGKDVTTETDAVYLYGDQLLEDAPFPSVRLPHQTFIFASFESPINLFRPQHLEPSSKWIKYFNATMTYRKNSEIFKPYGILDFQPKPATALPNYREIAGNKSRSVVWLVSNCKTQSNRMQYVRELQKYITVDIFGSCGQKCEVPDERCVKDISATYRFYLSFENSFSTDYVTEKFFKLFIDDMHVVPVVRGAFDYDKEFPVKSMVNAANFKGPKELADYLKSLEADQEEYIRYLEVKDRYRGLHQLNHWCPVCEFLHKLDKLPGERRHRQVDLRKELYDGQTLKPPPIV